MEELRIAGIGMGYVGLTRGMAFARHGFRSICTTMKPSKAEDLNKGIPPFYEPGLRSLLVR